MSGISVYYGSLPPPPLCVVTIHTLPLRGTALQLERMRTLTTHTFTLDSCTALEIYHQTFQLIDSFVNKDTRRLGGGQ